MAHLLMNFASAEDKIYYISSIILSLRFSMIVVVDLKSSYKESRAMAIAILSQISQFGVIAAQSLFIKNWTSAKILIIGFLKSFSLLICK